MFARLDAAKLAAVKRKTRNIKDRRIWTPYTFSVRTSRARYPLGRALSVLYV